jgi:hypothetical protein
MKWIDIKKELPTDDNNHGDSYNCVLVFSSFNNTVAFAQYMDDKWELLSDGIYSDVGIIAIDLDKLTHWMPLPDYPFSNQPERSKREDSQYCCEILLRLKYIFKDYRLLSDVRLYVKDLIKDCEMRCSEHCGNTVRDK